MLDPIFLQMEVSSWYSTRPNEVVNPLIIGSEEKLKMI